jgi:hypothetical protein
MRIGELSAAGGTGEWNREVLLAAPREKLTAIEDLQKRLSRTKSKLRNAAPTTSTASSPVSGLPSNRWLLTMCYRGCWLRGWVACIGG